MFLSEIAVSLLVRLWVEIASFICCSRTLWSASLWGCELKYRICCLFWRHVFVSLLVRLWVEMTIALASDSVIPVSLLVRLWVEISVSILTLSSTWSASLWGCELKYRKGICKHLLHVSLLVRLWVEIFLSTCAEIVLPSASLWGCELKYLS